MWMATTTTSSPSSTKPSMMASSSPLSVTSSSLHPMLKNSSRNSRWVGCPSLFFVSVVFCLDDIYIYYNFVCFYDQEYVPVHDGIVAKARWEAEQLELNASLQIDIAR